MDVLHIQRDVTNYVMVVSWVLTGYRASYELVGGGEGFPAFWASQITWYIISVTTERFYPVTCTGRVHGKLLFIFVNGCWNLTPLCYYVKHTFSEILQS